MLCCLSRFRRKMFALPYIFGAIGKESSRNTTNDSFVRNRRPPNVLIYTGRGEQSHERFERSKEFLRQCLDSDKYVIYQLQHDLISQEPWKENTELLVVTSDKVLEECYENEFDSYVKNGGKLLSFSKLYALNNSVRLCKVGSPMQEIRMCKKGELGVSVLVHSFDTAFEVRKEDNVEVVAITSSTSQPVIVSMLRGDGMAILSTTRVGMDRLDDEYSNEAKELLKWLLIILGIACTGLKKSLLTKAYLLGDDKGKEMFLKSVQDILIDKCFKGNNINIVFKDSDHEETSISNDNLPVITSCSMDQVSFCLPLYKQYLKTKNLGQLVIYSDVITSTQTILNGSLKLVRKLPGGCGLVMVGRQQTVGKGRGGNAWLSPDGCLSFSFTLQIDLDSNLGQRLPFIQHIAALAVVDAVRGMKGYEDVEIRIKWPNDIYFGKDTKIGGILVNSSVQGRNLYAIIGIGVNLDNSEPTTSINHIVEQQNIMSNAGLKKLSREQLLARILNETEDLVQDFQQQGPKYFCEKYHLRWLHSDAKVNLESENGELVVIKGLDDMGFLSVINSSNEVQSVQPDGNSFDMLRNLIKIKTRK